MKKRFSLDDDASVMPEAACPVCGATHGRATCLDGTASPSPGDLSVCISCGEWLVFADDLQLQFLEGEAYRQLPMDVQTRLADVSCAIRATKRQTVQQEARQQRGRRRF